MSSGSHFKASAMPTILAPVILCTGRLRPAHAVPLFRPPRERRGFFI
ncbi:hypothetical protein EKH55_2532 [Sinorhizobium alkalisoli]|nr:hypothetical protein EKH55_2532 [Sinorhizobium alkalisoli]